MILLEVEAFVKSLETIKSLYLLVRRTSLAHQSFYLSYFY